MESEIVRVVSLSTSKLSEMTLSKTDIQGPNTLTPKESNESGLLQQVVLQCRFYQVDLRRVVVLQQWSLKAGGLLIQMVSNTGLTVL